MKHKFIEVRVVRTPFHVKTIVVSLLFRTHNQRNDISLPQGDVRTY